MKLITEEVNDVEFLIEEANGKKKYAIEGVFMMAEKQNKNGRIYPLQVLQREAARYNKEYVVPKRALGELGHPENPTINLDRVSHLITSLKQDGSNFIGKAEIMDTPMGNIARGLLDSGVKLGVSTRGVGSLKPQNGYQLVQDDYKLATAADIVHEPSAHNAFVQGIMENVNWYYDNGHWKMAEASEDLKRKVRTFSKREIEDTALSLFENYISKL